MRLPANKLLFNIFNFYCFATSPQNKKWNKTVPCFELVLVSLYISLSRKQTWHLKKTFSLYKKMGLLPSTKIPWPRKVVGLQLFRYKSVCYLQLSLLHRHFHLFRVQLLQPTTENKKREDAEKIQRPFNKPTTKNK